MDRKYCVLLYSSFSRASIDLLTYIKELPIDFPTVTGMTIISIDNEKFRNMAIQNGIEYVPVLLVEYYNGTKQKFEREYIYMWIDQMMKASMAATVSTANVSNTPGNLKNKIVITPPPPEPTVAVQPVQEDVQEDVVEPSPMKREKIDITAMALEMQKSRDADIAAMGGKK
jgi:hypothetical protein